jgi:putative MATE family efflux protein
MSLPDTLMNMSEPVRKRSKMRDMTRGSIPRNLWHLSWPQMAESFFSVADQLADLFWAGRVGYKAIAGLGVSQTYIMMLMTARMGLDASMRAMISRAIGAGETSYANHVLVQSIVLTLAWSLVIGIPGIIFTDFLLGIVGVSEEVILITSGYMKWQFIAMSIMSFQRLTGGALQAAGDSITPLKAATVSRVIHLVSTPFLIFGWFVLPQMDLAGAGLANVIAQALGLSINLYVLFRGTSRLKLTFVGYRIDFSLMWRLIRVGVPAALTGMQRSSSQLILLIVVASFGDGPAAAFALSRRAENVVNHTSRGLGRAGGALAGQNLGAGHIERAKSTLSWAIVYSAVLSAFAMVIFFVFPNQIAEFFSDSPEFVDNTAAWIWILAFATFPMSSVQVFTQGIANTGATMAPMIITVSTMWLLEVPIAIILAQKTSLGSLGVPWGVVIGNSVRAIAFFVYFARGSWLKPGMM